MKLREMEVFFYKFLLNRSRARQRVSISDFVVKKPGEKRIAPLGKVPKVLWARGEQWSPAREAMKYEAERYSAASTQSTPFITALTALVRTLSPGTVKNGIFMRFS